MGLRQLEWVAHGSNRWIARIVETYFDGRSKPMTLRYAHVNIHPFHIPRREGKVFVEFQTRNNKDRSWHDSIEAAKLYVEAIFALDN
jgi:hypothetical protein